MNIVVKETSRKPDHISDTEWALRLDLAACYRLVEHYGMTQLVYNHITAKVPGPDKHFLINEYGLMYDEITASNLVKVDLAGNIVDGTAGTREINPAGYVIHSCIHSARDDVHCVLHTHSRAGVAVSCLKEGLLPMEQTGMLFEGRVAYHDYEGIAVDEDEQARLLADMGAHNIMILRNHGLLACGRTVSETFRAIYYLEFACRNQIDVMATGREINMPSKAVRDHTAEQFNGGQAGIGDGKGNTREWPALLRMLDRKDPSWRS
ncbi:MAG TPA: class II aldolase/adducin family protein [Alphaproteobacteria bacterium]|nr:class II aldolase/adducin family protein [Alphaproteobacteria bacterium]